MKNTLLIVALIGGMFALSGCLVYDDPYYRPATTTYYHYSPDVRLEFHRIESSHHHHYKAPSKPSKPKGPVLNPPKAPRQKAAPAKPKGQQKATSPTSHPAPKNGGKTTVTPPASRHVTPSSSSSGGRPRPSSSGRPANGGPAKKK